MRKVLITILIVILLLVGYLMLFKGLNVLNINVLSVEEIKNKNIDLDTKLQKVSTLTSVDQPKAMSELNSSVKELVIAKEEYNDKVLYSSSDNIAEASQGIQYEVETLWVKIGNHATKNGIILKFELKPTGVTSQYNLNFTVTGSYVSISEFVASLENDSTLNFKIEDFKLVPTTDSTENLQATFVVKEINVKVGKSTTTPTTTTSEVNGVTDSTNTNP